MKYLNDLIVSSLLLIFTTGCNSIFPPKYESNQFMQLVKIHTHIESILPQCKYPVIVEQKLHLLRWETKVFNTYSLYLPRNDEIYQISEILLSNIDQMLARYTSNNTPSETYCQLKSQQLLTNITNTLQTIGNLQIIQTHEQ